MIKTLKMVETTHSSNHLTKIKQKIHDKKPKDAQMGPKMFAQDREECHFSLSLMQLLKTFKKNRMQKQSK